MMNLAKGETVRYYRIPFFFFIPQDMGCIKQFRVL
jgi:hypothetical protein